MAATSLATRANRPAPAPAARRGDRRRDRSSRASASRPDDDGALVPSPSTPSSSFGVAAVGAVASRRALSAASASAVVLPGAPTLAIPSYNVTLAKLDKEARDRHSAQLLAPAPSRPKRHEDSRDSQRRARSSPKWAAAP